MSVETAQRYPVRTALVRARRRGASPRRLSPLRRVFDNIITCDMGGTSFDVSLIAGGEAALAAQTAIDFGMVVRTPMIEITTIGAGGGSIACVDEGGLLQVGPESRGSDPGPVCYGLGNDRPTVTDANLVLGRINADRPIGGKLDRLDVEAARAAIARRSPSRWVSARGGGRGDPQVANAKMAGAIRLVSIERGHDPARFAAMPFGGGGALHAGALIEEVGLRRALVPRFPGVTSALGCVVADMRHDRVRTVNRLLDGSRRAGLGREMRAASRRDCARCSTAPAWRSRGSKQVYELDMLYLGQTHTVAVPLTIPRNRPDAKRRSRAAFDEAYRAAYGRLLENIPMRVMN